MRAPIALAGLAAFVGAALGGVLLAPPAALGAPSHGRLSAAGLAFRFGYRAQGGQRPVAPIQMSASSWQRLVVVPGGAPLPPKCLVATRPAGAAPRPAIKTPLERAP